MLNRSIVPFWEELLVFNEDFEYILRDDSPVLILFEVLDFVNFTVASSNYRKLGKCRHLSGGVNSKQSTALCKQKCHLHCRILFSFSFYLCFIFNGKNYKTFQRWQILHILEPYIKKGHTCKDLRSSNV